MRRDLTAGFSMIELMVTLAIVAILIVVAFPSFESSMRSNRLATTTNEVIASLSLARMEALRSPGRAVICTSENGTSCGGDWNSGWMVWIDGDGDGQGNPSGSADRVLRYVQGNSRLDITATSLGDANRVVFDNRGRSVAEPPQIVIQPDTCPSTQQLARQVDVARTGQVRTKKVDCS